MMQKPGLLCVNCYQAATWRTRTAHWHGKRFPVDLASDETGIFLCTAHPAKFKETIEDVLQTPIGIARRTRKG